MTGRLAGRVAVVTGGAQGIGEAVVEKFLAEEARVAFLDRDEERGHAVAERLGGDVAFHACDVTAREQVDRALARVTETYGRIDALVNNAGVSAYFDAVEMTDAEWDTVFAVDLKGVWLCTRGVLAGMRAAGSGSIVNVSSIHARMTTTGMFPYAAAKAGVSGLTRSLALDEGPNGIRVNAVCPGYTRTQLVQEYIDRQPDPATTERTIVDVHPLGRIATPAEIAAVCAFLAGDEASFVTGAEIYVDGGLSAKFAS